MMDKTTRTGAGTTGLAVVIVWGWNMWRPDSPMPGEVAVGIVAAIGALWSRIEAAMESRSGKPDAADA